MEVKTTEPQEELLQILGRYINEAGIKGRTAGHVYHLLKDTAVTTWKESPANICQYLEGLLEVVSIPEVAGRLPETYTGKPYGFVLVRLLKFFRAISEGGAVDEMQLLDARCNRMEPREAIALCEAYKIRLLNANSYLHNVEPEN